MRQMPHLTLLTLNIYFTSPETQQAWPTITQSVLPKLRHLKIFTFQVSFLLLLPSALSRRGWPVQELDGEIFSAWFNATFPSSVRRLDVESSLQTQDFVLKLNTPLKRLGVLLNNDEVNPDSYCVRIARSDALRKSLRVLTLDGPYAAFRNVERCQFPALWKVELVWSKKGKERIEDHLQWLAEEQKRLATRKRCSSICPHCDSFITSNCN